MRPRGFATDGDARPACKYANRFCDSLPAAPCAPAASRRPTSFSPVAPVFALFMLRRTTPRSMPHVACRTSRAGLAVGDDAVHVVAPRRNIHRCPHRRPNSQTACAFQVPPATPCCPVVRRRPHVCLARRHWRCGALPIATLRYRRAPFRMARFVHVSLRPMRRATMQPALLRRAMMSEDALMRAHNAKPCSRFATGNSSLPGRLSPPRVLLASRTLRRRAVPFATLC